MSTKPLQLTHEELTWLVTNKKIVPNVYSPFAFLAVRDAELPPASLVQKAGAALTRRDLVGDARHMRLLEIVSKPTLRLRVSGQVSGKQPFLTSFFVHRGDAAPAAFDNKGFLFGPAMSTIQLIDALVTQIAPAPSVTGAAFYFHTVRLAGRVFKANAAASVPLDANSKLLVGLGAAVAKGTKVTLTPTARELFGLLWSGHWFELVAGTPKRSERMFFVGPPRKRVLMVGAEAPLESAEASPADVAVATFSAMPTVQLKSALLRLTRA